MTAPARTDPTAATSTATGPDDVAHYARKAVSCDCCPPAPTITEGAILGTPVTALCGHVFVPLRSPAGRPVCQACAAIIADDAIMSAPPV